MHVALYQVMFLVMMALELLAGRLRQKKLYRFNDLLASISSGTCQQLFGALAAKAIQNKRMYAWVQRHCGLLCVNVKAMPLISWLCLLLGVDLAYYWAHRCLHCVHLGWAAHSVHHTGEDYNLATALRQGALQPLMTSVFSVPLALFFPPEAIAIHQQLNTLYQFWIHTELCGRLGPLEYLLNTPFQHRMHHRPPGNCNYAGVLIIWDRFFKTYRAETERLDYFGLALKAESFNPLELNLLHWRRMKEGRGHGDCLWRVVQGSLMRRILARFRSKS